LLESPCFEPGKGNAVQPYRQVFWNISNYYIFYALAALATAIFFYGFYRRYRLWRSGWLEKRSPGFDWKLVAGRIFLNASILKGDPLGGATHLCIMWGFIFLFIGTALSTIDHWLIHYLKGGLYLGYAFVLDMAGLVLIGGIVLAYLRRYVFKREKMVTVVRDHVVLAVLLFVTVTGFLVEGLRLRAEMLPWHEPSPAGQWIAAVSGLSADEALLDHRIWWWVHAAASLFLIAYFPFSKFVHVFAAPVNITLEGMRFDPFLSLEEREALASDLSFRQRIMCDACTQCNRCTVVCPSSTAGESLSPRVVVDEVGRFLRRKYGFMPFSKPDAGLARRDAARGDAVWYCTTCSHCYRECPNAISAMDIIREVRTARIESGEEVPETIQAMLESVYKFKNPWQGAKGKRIDWAAGLEVPVFSDGASATRCFYVGCTFAYDARLQEVPRSAVAIFKASAYHFAVLGKDEVCCSEFVRGVGEDGLFTELATQNVGAFERYRIEEIVTPCPHGFHTFSNEYRRMDGSMGAKKVFHISQVLEGLLRSGSLILKTMGERAVTYHDPCFLGRRNGVFDAPRNVIRSIPGVRLIEMPRSRERSFCCGGGGGRMWVEATEGEKIAEVRVREAAGTGADMIVTACPFCFTNLDDAVKTAGFEGRIVVKDLTELVAECLPAPGEGP
jgi:Fe-S oxidoreductase/nitrate reductase gamma subunit